MSQPFTAGGAQLRPLLVLEYSFFVTTGACDSHLWVDFRGDADAVISGDGELVVQDPAGGAGAGLATPVGGERVQVGHVAVSQQEVVT